MRVAVVGLGYVGIPVAASLARVGMDVFGIDVDKRKVRCINRGENPLSGKEPGLAEIVRRAVDSGRLKAYDDPSLVGQCDAVIVAVETPIDERSKEPDFTSLESALISTSPHLRRGSLISVESTLAPGTMAGVVKPLLEKGSAMSIPKSLSLAYFPERLTAGKLLYNLANLDRVLGVEDDVTKRKALKLYRKIVKGRIHVSNWLTAEVVKTVENAYWDVQLAFANEVALLSEKIGVDAFEVRELVNTCPWRNMLLPGAGVGGHCIPKDPWLLLSAARPLKTRLIPAARAVNRFMPHRVAQLVEQGLGEAGRDVRGAVVTVLGFAYKENTDDFRNSPAIPLVRELRRKGTEVRIHDPYVSKARGFAISKDIEATLKGSDCVVIVTAHDQYKKLGWRKFGALMRTRILIDGRNILRGGAPSGFVYKGLGKGRS